MNRTISAAAIAIVLAGDACSSSSSPTSIGVSSPTFTGSVTDPVGDTVITPVIRNGVTLTPVIPVRPDLIAATLDVSGGTLTATVSFAAGTLSHADTIFCVLVDIDENPATGNPGGGADNATFGWDYSICAVNPRGSTTAQISRADTPTGGLGIGSVPMTFPSADQARFSVPLSTLGNDDGRMSFKVRSLQWLDAPILNSDTIDTMPDVGRPPGLVR
jgi:hypothetical protein